MSTDIEFSKAQISKITQSGESFGSWLANLLRLISRDNLPGLVSNLASNSINKFERKTSGKRALKASKGFT